MAFGSVIASATGSQTATGTTASTSTALSVSVGDLVVAAFGVRDASGASLATFTDNLSNTWTALSQIGTNSACLSAAFTIVTNAGSMTVTGTVPSTAQAKNIVAGQFSGPFSASPLDANPACVTGTSGTISGPATGTLAQASELIISCCSQIASALPVAVSPFSLVNQIGSGSGTKQSSISMESEVVSSTASVTPQWTTTANCAIGTTSFKAASGIPNKSITIMQSTQRASFW